MIQKKWFRVETGKDGSVLSCEEVEAKGRSGAVVRFYEAIDKAAACSAAKSWWEDKLRKAVVSGADRRLRYAKDGLCETCGKSPVATDTRDRWGNPRGRASTQCRACLDKAAHYRELRKAGVRTRETRLGPDESFRREKERQRRSHEIDRQRAGGSAATFYLRMLKKLDAIGHVAFRAWLVSRIPALQQTQEWHPPLEYPMAEAAE